MAKFRVDQDSAGNPEISSKKPRNLKPLDDDDMASPPKSALKQPKSALKGSAAPSPPAPVKSALKSALKSSAPIPEPEQEPAGSPPKATKSALKRRDPPPDEGSFSISPPAGSPTRPKAKSAMKSSQKKTTTSGDDEPMTKKASVGSSQSGNGSGRAKHARPSLFKMTVDIAEAEAWTCRGLCRHYFHFVAQKMLWEQAMKDQASHATSRKSIKVTDILQLGQLEVKAEAIKEDVHVATDSISPLKDLFLAKKPDAGKVRDVLKGFSNEDTTKWVNAPLDATPPPMPAPLFFAVAGVHANLVEVLIEFGVDAHAQYPGKSMLKGWVKPNSPLVDSVQGRKGRFLGTMLGDKLESIEAMLKKAQSTGATELEIPAAPTMGRRKSVQMKCSQGSMEHTHDHPSSRYELVAHHDDGNTSNVREAVNIQSGEVYAIKAGSKVDEASATDPEAALWNEIGIIRKLDHPNIVRLHETFENDSHIFMVLEGCLGGDLFDRLVSEGAIGETPAVRLGYQMGSALRHLHQIQICHRDVQPEAFFLAECGPLEATGVKLIDFSSAREFATDQKMFTKVCTLHYAAPEIVSSSDGYSEKVDIWSLGVLLFTMICGQPPFNAPNEMDTLNLIKDGKFQFEPAQKWSSVSADTKDLISKCLTVDAAQRPSTWQIMDHPIMCKAESEGATYAASAKLGRSVDGNTERIASNMVKTAFSMLAEVITDDQVEELRSHFSDLDDAKDGMIELEDTVEKLKEMVEDNEDAQDLRRVLSEGGVSGRVNYLMYMATMTDRRRQLKREAARAVFNNFDIDKNGNISLYEIAQALDKHTEINLSKVSQVSVKEVQKIWLEMRVVFTIEEGQHLEDKEMTFDEFFKLLPSSSKWDIGF